jgi:phosphatidylglycerophosphate synthase
MITRGGGDATLITQLFRPGPLAGLVAQVVLLGVLAATVDLGPAGWVAGLTYAACVCAALTWGMHRAGAAVLRPADRVTLARAVLVGGVTALVADAAFHRPPPVAVLVAVASVALALDALDGQVARRTGTSSDLGARFDMEVDAFLIFVLSVAVGLWMGLWVLAIGAMRYAFVAAGWVLPWLNGPLPPRFWRKVVAATQGIVLTVVVADVLPRPMAVVAVAGSLALLVESFARDIRWRWWHRATLENRTFNAG